jgi:hypothetical protein
VREREREREREATHDKATDWMEERKRLSKRAGEREMNKSGLKISNWQEFGGFTSVQNFLQAP